VAVPFGISSSRRVVLEPFDAEAARCEPPPLFPLNFCQERVNLVRDAPPDSQLRQAGELVFDELGGSPCNVYKSVHLKDDLTASLLQARLVELNLPIKVKVGPLS